MVVREVKRLRVAVRKVTMSHTRPTWVVGPVLSRAFVDESEIKLEESERENGHTFRHFPC
jgi:hypothetical protein